MFSEGNLSADISKATNGEKEVTEQSALIHPVAQLFSASYLVFVHSLTNKCFPLLVAGSSDPRKKLHYFMPSSTASSVIPLHRVWTPEAALLSDKARGLDIADPLPPLAMYRWDLLQLLKVCGTSGGTKILVCCSDLSEKGLLKIFAALKTRWPGFNFFFFFLSCLSPVRGHGSALKSTVASFLDSSVYIKNVCPL